MENNTMEENVNQHPLSAPLYVVWEINKVCNVECIHCYTASSPSANEHGILTTEEAINVAEELSRLKIFHIGLSGGEPLLRRDCINLIKILNSKGTSVTVGTNGMIITKDIAKKLKKAGTHSVCISIDSHKDQLHDYIRKSPGLFNHAIRAVKILLEEGVNVVVGLTALKHNFLEIKEFINFVINLGVSSINITGFVPVGRGTFDLDLNKDQLSDFLSKVNHYAFIYKDRISIKWHDCRHALINKEIDNYSLVGCGAANTMCRIRFNGDVTPCSTLPISAGNLRNESFKNIWENSSLFKHIKDRRNFKKGTNCERCKYLKKCGGCRSISYAYYNDPFSNNPHCWINEAES